MHVLIIPSWYPEYPEDIRGCFFREQALALQKYGCKVGVIYPQLRSLRNWKSAFGGKYGIHRELDNGLVTFRYHMMSWIPRMQNIWAMFWVRGGLIAYEAYVKECGHPDIIHVHSTLYGGCVALKVYDLYHIPYIITEHSTSFARGNVDDAQKKISKVAVTGAKARLAVSVEFASLLNRFYADQSCIWQYLPNIVNESFLNFPLEMNGTSEKFIFVNVAFQTEKKAIGSLIKSFAIAFAGSLNVTLQLVGDGPEQERLRQLSSQLGVSKQVVFLGARKRQEVLETVAAANAFVLSSRYETFGVVIVEALALGKPVVATRCGGPESIISNEDGILVDVDDIDALADAMLDVYTNYSNYHSEGIRQKCLERFGEEAVTTQLKMVYDGVLLAQKSMCVNS